MLSTPLIVVGCLCSSAGGLACPLAAMLEIEAEVGRIPEKDEIEKDGDCWPEWYALLLCSKSWETKSGAKVWKPVEALLAVFVRVFAV